jgi:hypothetical protein
VETKNILLFLIFALLAQLADAQGNANISTVYLNNQSVLIGKLVKSNSSDRYRITIPNGTVLYLGATSIASINSSAPPPQTSSMTGDEATVYLKNGSIVKGLLRKNSTAGQYRAVMPNGSVFYFPTAAVKSIEYAEMANNALRTAKTSGQNERALALQAQFKSGSRQKIIGNIMWITGLAATAGGVAMLVAGAPTMDTSSLDANGNIKIEHKELLTAGAITAIAGTALVSAGIPVAVVGSIRKNNAKKALQNEGLADCQWLDDAMRMKAAPRLQFNLYAGGAGLAYVF